MTLSRKQIEEWRHQFAAAWWGNLPERVELDLLCDMALRAMPEREGWVSVPMEPTKEMKEAGEAGWWDLPNRFLAERAGDCYRAMLAALQSEEK